MVELAAVIVTLVWVADLTGVATPPADEVGRGLGFEFQIGLWLWFTVLFATYAEAIAEARGRAQASSLRRTRSETSARRRGPDGSLVDVGSSELRAGDVVVVRAGETIPGDGDVIEGVAYVNEAAITGESAPVLKEPGTDIRSTVTGGTTLTSDELVIRITANPGETFLDRMIALVEGAKRQRTPERDRAVHPADGVVAGLPPGHGHAAPVRRVRGHDARRRRARGAARLPHPDHDRRAAVRDRDRRHGPGRAVQRPGDERAGRGGRRGRGRPAARQDGHDHVRQPARLEHPATPRGRGGGRTARRPDRLAG